MALLDIQKVKKDWWVWIALLLFLFRQDIRNLIEPLMSSDAGDGSSAGFSLSPEVIPFLVVIGVFFGPMIAIWVFNSRQSKNDSAYSQVKKRSQAPGSASPQSEGMLMDGSSQVAQGSSAHSNHNVDMHTGKKGLASNAFSLDGK